MTKKYCDSPIHKVSSLALAFIILAFCVLPSFVHADSVRPNEPVGWKDGDTFRDILLVVLDSWGISFSKSDSSDTTSILDYSDQLMQEFYEDNETTQELFWDLVKYGADETGNLILDFLGVNKIRQFANWLVDKFSLTDNGSVDTNPFSTNTVFINNHPLYSGVVYHGPGQSTTWEFFVQGSGAFYWTTNSSMYTMNVVSFSSDTVLRRVDLTTQTVTDYPLNQVDGNYYYRVSTSSVFGSWKTDILPYTYPVVSPNKPSSYFGSASSFDNVTSAGGLVINTTVINIPSEDLDPDDGLQIEIPGTNWGDSIYTILDLIERLIGLYDNTQLEIISIIDTLDNLLENLQHSVTVENIPGAVILDYDDYDIPLENEWGLFDIFFNTGGDEITLLRPWQELRAIIYGFPAPILSFFALVVLFIVAYGFIRMGRDSH